MSSPLADRRRCSKSHSVRSIRCCSTWPVCSIRCRSRFDPPGSSLHYSTPDCMDSTWSDSRSTADPSHSKGRLRGCSTSCRIHSNHRRSTIARSRNSCFRSTGRGSIRCCNNFHQRDSILRSLRNKVPHNRIRHNSFHRQDSTHPFPRSTDPHSIGHCNNFPLRDNKARRNRDRHSIDCCSNSYPRRDSTRLFPRNTVRRNIVHCNSFPPPGSTRLFLRSTVRRSMIRRSNSRPLHSIHLHNKVPHNRHSRSSIRRRSNRPHTRCSNPRLQNRAGSCSPNRPDPDLHRDRSRSSIRHWSRARWR